MYVFTGLKKLLLILQILFITGSFLKAQQDIGVNSKIDEYLTAHHKMNQFNGSVLVAQEGKVILNKGYGMAVEEFDIPNDPQTKFRIGSLTKQFAAMAIMILEEKGMLSTDDYLSKYIPDYPNGYKIKLEHLLSHTSGIPDHTELEDFNKDRRVYHYDLKKTIETFKYLPLEFSPGEKFRYSNSGYILLGYIIEKVANESYENFIAKNIFEPLNMINSGYEHVDKIVKHHACGYAFKNDEIEKADYRNISNAQASGALYLTTGDIYLWDRALYTDKLVSPKSLEKMFTPVTENYGYGWGIVNILNRKMVGHNGETEGFSSNITRFPNENVCIILLSNLEEAPVGKVGIDVAAILFGENYKVPKIRNIVKVNPDILDEYVGEYELEPNFSFTISKENTQLYCKATGQKAFEIYPESESEFFLKVIDAQISFVRGKNNKVEKLVLHQNGKDFAAKKK